MTILHDRLVEAVEREIDVREMVDASPSRIRRLRAERVVRVMLKTLREPDGETIYAGELAAAKTPLGRSRVAYSFTAIIDAIRGK